MRAAGLLISTLLLLAPAAARAEVDAEGFRAFLDEVVRPAAQAAGVSDTTFAAAVRGLAPDPALPDLAPLGATPPARDVFQAEFRDPGRYLDAGNLAALARTGRRLAGRWGETLAAVERRTGVPGAVLLAIWGRESNFGAAEIGKDGIRTLATQAYAGARRDAFLPELVAALRILEEDHVPAGTLRSSWAGALGQPQFLPSKFLAHAVDGDGDGRRDIWTSVPDVLASIGRYLADHGWVAGRPWGAEVVLPDAVACTLEGPLQGRPAAGWAAMGVRRVDGGPLAALGDPAYLMLPAGRHGPAFLVSENFWVLKRYNESDLYAVFVGHLADRIAGTSAAIAGGWSAPSGFRRADVRDLQRELERRGHDVGGADGLVGFRTRIAVGREQERAGAAPTCFPDADMLRRGAP